MGGRQFSLPTSSKAACVRGIRWGGRLKFARQNLAFFFDGGSVGEEMEKAVDFIVESSSISV